MASGGMRIACVGIVGKKNEPLALRVYRDGVALDALDTKIESEQDSHLLRFHYLVYYSLDVVDERHKPPGATGMPTTERSHNPAEYKRMLCAPHT